VKKNMADVKNVGVNHHYAISVKMLKLIINVNCVTRKYATNIKKYVTIVEQNAWIATNIITKQVVKIVGVIYLQKM
jgi:hypothetical protein